MLIISRIRLAAAVVAITLAVATHLPAQGFEATEPKLGSIIGTVTDVNGDPVPNSTVLLKSVDSDDRRTVVTPENGFFEFHGIRPGVPYEISITAKDFADWISPAITLEPGQFKIVTGIQLRIATEHTQVEVTYDPVEAATAQLRIEEKQRVFGIIPNFYVSYETNPAPLTAKMKFELALRVSIDPVTAVGVALVSASKQAANSPKYGQGWDAYGERFGSIAADGFTDIMIGGAILPSLLHQDPRYFYQGTGTTSSRMRHAIFSPFVTKGDNGEWQPNYSSLAGDLASSAIANLYYPRSNRGVGLVFGNFAIGTAERVGASLAQEFLVGRFTRRGGHVK
ncbi:MAG TPA: carboxypeptidase-like regulatory domain-containing protein [Terriglobales bacterium]|nr:carboxypeptidase-like regulatory domain-containing protein [Terriglobales bacterium]